LKKRSLAKGKDWDADNEQSGDMISDSAESSTSEREGAEEEPSSRKRASVGEITPDINDPEAVDDMNRKEFYEHVISAAYQMGQAKGRELGSVSGYYYAYMNDMGMVKSVSVCVCVCV